ncbi:MAG: protein kinase [Pseudomonadales bacterium]|nr:protein kinase [Pseudomonadales bacterium]
MIEIPDTRVDQAIRVGTPIEIYRGIFGQDHRAVVIKALSANAKGTSIERRFRIGLGIHTNLHHAGIIDQLLTGEVDGRPYSIEPYLSGGDLLRRLETGISLQAGLKYLKDIARALAYLHDEGIVHGDIKPENLLFASNTQIYLVDFSVTRRWAEQPGELGRGTAVLATPEYMAPEALSGPDTRSDIYSLGIVFYRILTGKLPFTGDTPQMVIAKHAQEAIPRLPEYLVHLQPIVDKALAKRPEQRYQSALEFVRDVDEIRLSVDLPQVNMKTRPIATQEIRALSNGNVLATVRDAGRQERMQARSQRRRRARNIVSLTFLLFGLGYGGYFAFENGYVPTDRILAELGVVADPEVAIAWNEAQSLRQDPNQGLAAIVAAFRRVLSIAPDHIGANEELESLAADWKTSIADALDDNNLQFAETRLNEANAVFPNDLDWANLNSDLLNRLSAERIYGNSVTLLNSQGFSDLPSATAAIQSFHEVLRLAPGHPDATTQLRELAVHYANLSNNAIAEGRLNDGISLLERATAADGSIPKLDEVRKLISQATTARATIDDLLREARRLRSDDQLMSPAGENAAELYHRVLATDPENAIASQGLNEITAQVAQDAEALLSEGELERVDALVTQAQAAALPTEGVEEIRRRLQVERTRQQTITDNITNARSLMAAGFLTQPIGNNAVDNLREVQQVDPGNEIALAMLQSCADRLAAVAMEAREFGLSEDAEQYLDLAITIHPDATEWITLRDSWESAQVQ